jgi:hypothetical protein
MFRDLMKYDWMARPLTYPSTSALLRVFKPAVIDEAFRIHKTIDIIGDSV